MADPAQPAGLAPLEPIMSEQAWVAAQQRLARERGSVPKKTSVLQAEWRAMRLRQRRAASIEARAALAALPDVHTALAQQMGAITGRTSAKLVASVAAARNNELANRAVTAFLDQSGLVIRPEAFGAKGDSNALINYKVAAPDAGPTITPEPAAAQKPKHLKPEVAERIRLLQEQAQALMEACTEVRNNFREYTTAQAKRLLEDRIALTRGTVNAFVSAEGLDTDRMKYISKKHESQLLDSWGRTVRRRTRP